MADNGFDLPDLDDRHIKPMPELQGQMQPSQPSQQQQGAPQQRQGQVPQRAPQSGFSTGYQDRSGRDLPELGSNMIKGPGTAEGLPEEESGTLEGVYEYFKTPEGQRMALEVLGGTAAGLVAPQVAIPRLAAQFGPKAASMAYRALQSSGALRVGATAGQSAGGSAAGSLAAEGVDPSQSTNTAFRRAGESAAYGAAGSVAGDVLGLAGRTAMQPFRNALEPEALEANKFLRAETGESMTPGQLTTGGQTGLDQLENIARAGFFSGGLMERKTLQASEAAEGLARNLARDWTATTSKEEIGQGMKMLLEGQADAFRTTASGFFKQLSKMTGDATVDIAPIKREARRMLAEKRRGFNSPQMTKLVKELDAKDDAVDFGTAQELRSDLLAITRGGRDELVEGKAQGPAKELAKQIDSKMAEAAKGQGDEVLRKFRQANEFWKQGKEKFNSNFVRSVLNSEDPKVLNTIFDPENPQRLRQVRDMVGEGPAWQEFKGHWIRSQLFNASDASNRLSGEALKRQFNKWTQEGNNALKEMFSDQEISRMDKVFTALQKSQAAGSSKTGPAVFLAMAQAGAFGTALGLATGSVGAGAAGGATTILMAPRAIARLMTSRAGHRYLTEGIKAPPGSRQAKRVFGQVVGHLAHDKELKQGEDYQVMSPNPGNPLIRDSGERSDNQG